MSFSTLKLSGERVVVRGADRTGVEGETVLNAAEWNAIKTARDGDKAEAEFNATVEAFFAPITEAIDALESSRRGEDADPATFVVVDEGVEGTPSRPRRVASLSRDSIVLRLLEEGKDDRLVWVLDQLEVLDAAAPSVGVEPHELDDAAITEG